MGQLVKHDLVIEVAVSVGGGPIEDIHLHPGRSSVSRRREIRIVERGRVLGLGLHGITAQSAAPEIVVLKVSRRLGETERVESVVIAVRPEEEVRDGAHTVIRPRRRIAPARRGVVGEREVAAAWTRPARHTGGLTARIDAIEAVDVEPGIDVVARRHARAVGNPSQVVEARQLADQGEPRPCDGGRLLVVDRSRV